MGRSHIPIAAPELNHTDYYNRKGWYLMLVQVVVDHDYLFRDICVGWAGSVHDARVFMNSLLYNKITEDGTMLKVLQFLVNRSCAWLVIQHTPLAYGHLLTTPPSLHSKNTSIIGYQELALLLRLLLDI